MHDVAIDIDQSDSRGRFRLRRSGAVVAVLVTTALMASACSSGSASPGVASLGTSQTSADHGGSSSDPSGAATSGAPGGPGSQSGGVIISGGSGSSSNGLAFSQCMRSHGVASFPDPNSQGQISFGSGNGIDSQSPQFQSAQQACQKLLPNGGQPTPAQQAQALAAALKMSQCMRAHGITDFPDPSTKGGGIQIKLNGGSGGDLNPQSPLFQSAQKACAKDLPGKIGAAGTPKSSFSAGAP
ncbi:MAG: hypothetical protein WBG41_07460 [Acidimicrobiales bacterium]